MTVLESPPFGQSTTELVPGDIAESDTLFPAEPANESNVCCVTVACRLVNR